MRIEDGIKLDFDDVLIKPKRSSINSRSDIQLERTFNFKKSNKSWTGVPIIAANMYATGSFEMARELAKHNMVTALHKFHKIDDLVDFFFEMQGSWDNIFYTIGVKNEDISKLRNVAYKLYLKINNLKIKQTTPAFYQECVDKMFKTFPRMLCVDVANGYHEHFLNKVKEIRKIFPNTILMAGNVVTNEITEELILSGVEIIKIGIGQGSGCLTRIKTGVGFPQLESVINCADAAHGLGGLVCADGGCRTPGDICKIFGSGADFCMLGGMFAGTDECNGKWKWKDITDGVIYDDCSDNLKSKYKKVLEFYGMSSKEAQENHNGGIKEYRASEGRCVHVSYKGPVKNVVQDVLGGIRSACSYIGAAKLKDFSKCTTFIRINNGRTHNTIFENL